MPTRAYGAPNADARADGLRAALAACPVLAILRGVRAENAAAIATALVDAGVTLIEIPLNEPHARAALTAIVAACGERALIGAGTVTQHDEITLCVALGLRFVVSPHIDPALVVAAKTRGLFAIPGVMTPTEAFTARAAGADALKLFPAEQIPPRMTRALRTTLGPETLLLAVGGVTAETMRAYAYGGVDGYGLGAALYTAGRPVAAVKAAAEALVAAARAAQQSRRLREDTP